MQADFCHWGAISRNLSDRQFLKKSQGHSYETSCYIFSYSFEKIDVAKSLKNTEPCCFDEAVCDTKCGIVNNDNRFVRPEGRDIALDLVHIVLRHSLVLGLALLL